MPVDVIAPAPRRPVSASKRIASALSRLAVTALLLAAMSCGDSTSPKSMNVTISVLRVAGPDVATYQDTLTIISCSVELSATATGTDTASWLDGMVRWYAGVDRSKPLDSLPIHTADVRLTWGNNDIGAGQTQTSHWQVQAAVPYHAEFEYRYQPRHSNVKTASGSFDCGPLVAPGTLPPSIDSVSLPDNPPGLLPGDSLTVDYTASSPVGIVTSAVELSGPCTSQVRFPELLKTRFTRSAKLAVPANCPIGVPITITVVATDGGFQTSSKPFPRQIPMLDGTPPTVQAVFSPPWNGTPTGAPYPIYFDGDTIPAVVSASDNHALSSVVWDASPAGSGIGDSIAAVGRSFVHPIGIRLQPGKVGPVQVRIVARDSVGLISDTLTTLPGAIQVYPKVALQTSVGTVMGPTPDALVEPRHQLAFLPQPIDGHMTVMSLSTMTATQTLSITPEDLDVTPGGDSVIVALGGAGLGIIDLRESPLTVSVLPLAPVDSTGAAGARFVRTLSNGKVFVTAAGSYLVEVDLATGVQRVRRDAGNNGYINGAALGRSLDHSVVVLNGSGNYFQRYDVSTDSFGPLSQSSVPGATPVLDSTGQHVVVGLTIYDSSLQPLREAANPLAPGEFIPTVLSPDGNTLYEVMPYPRIVMCRVSDGAIIGGVENPVPSIISWPRISDDGTLLITAQRGSPGANGVGVIRLR